MVVKLQIMKGRKWQEIICKWKTLKGREIIWVKRSHGHISASSFDSEHELQGMFPLTHKHACTHTYMLVKIHVQHTHASTYSTDTNTHTHTHIHIQHRHIHTRYGSVANDSVRTKVSRRRTTRTDSQNKRTDYF